MINFNSIEMLDEIDNQTAAVVVEPYQAASGFVKADKSFLKKIREKCTDHGVLLIYLNIFMFTAMKSTILDSLLLITICLTS